MQALPVARLIRAQHPTAEIHWWISNDLAPLLENDPDISVLHLFHRRRWAHPCYWLELKQSLSKMRLASYDLVLDLQGLARSAAIAWLARGQLTVGVEDRREGAPLFYDRAVPRPGGQSHAVDWYLEVLRAVGINTDRPFDWIPLQKTVSESIKQRWRLPEGAEWIALNPGARWANKRWPVQSFAALAGSLARSHPHFRFMVLGGPSDSEAGLAIQKAIGNDERCLDLTARTSLPELVEWIRMASVLVTNDTGPMHIAAALGRPVIGLFGPTNPNRTGPYGQIDRVLRLKLECMPCMSARCSNSVYQECLSDLQPSVVHSMVSRILHEKAVSPNAG